MATNTQLIDMIVEAEGFEDDMALFEHAVFDSIVPSICTECHGISEMEPDQDAGWCDECKTNTVKSCLILGGII